MTKRPVTTVMNGRQRELLDGAARMVYKQLDDGDSLDLHVFSPAVGEDRRAVIVFFHGGGFWERGELSQFAPQCLHFVERGMVAVLADYRLGKRRGATPLDGVEDARDAVDWIFDHAGELGIDPEKLVLAGASSGAHVSLVMAMDPEREPGRPPAAMVLFSPIVNVVRDGVEEMFGPKRAAKLASPLHQVRKGLPPMQLFHGGADPVQAVGDVEAFAKKMVKKKNLCELDVFGGEGASFFNFNVNAALYEATLNSADSFLVHQGLLAGGRDGSATTRIGTWR